MGPSKASWRFSLISGDRHSLVRRDHFAAIGIGDVVATANLVRHEIDERSSMSRVLYVVYESHKLCERIGGIGENLMGVIRYQSGTVHTDLVSRDGRDLLTGLYETEYGPKQAPSKIDLGKGFFVP